MESDVQDTVKETFGNVVRAHYVERCPAPEPSVSPRPPPEKRSPSLVKGLSCPNIVILIGLVIQRTECLLPDQVYFHGFNILSMKSKVQSSVSVS